MGIETISRGAKLSYEQHFAQDVGVDKVLFPNQDTDTSAAVMIDRYTQAPYAIAYRDTNRESYVRQFEAGSSYLYEVPRASEKTKIDETLRDVIAGGKEATASQGQHIRKIMDDIVKDHVAAHRITRWKQALDVIFDAAFYARGPGGQQIYLDIDFKRDAGNWMTHNFRTATMTVSKALTAMQEKLISKGTPNTQMVIIMGQTYLQNFFKDTEVQKYLQTNEANYLLRQELLPQRLVNQTSGLVVNAVYRAPQMVAPVYVCTYSPGVSYVKAKNVAAEAWVADRKAAMFSLLSPNYHIQRGVDALDEGGNVVRAVGEIVFDSFEEQDPIGSFIRSQTRHAYIPGNVNHSVVSTGTWS